MTIHIECHFQGITQLSRRGAESFIVRLFASGFTSCDFFEIKLTNLPSCGPGGRCEGYGFQALYSGLGYRNQTVLV